ncbi:D-tyrosyl-tRNA(Tyr) deacylase [Geobacillus genomosp. 3]|uniref:D-aminoacyl-tRNA deacylase n=1 Tax=Geobacillus genomosp. 3 TaxID=1921421 RepID=S5ZR70_GEOG3|nr:D-aminoacyl-tRNA deacylase [Geobacillus genomosp. 3]AGT32913.1 D-tyrosyl-tRNA(Tyr) deacylase [Geobacillus genomosp. 3]
MRAVIQRAKQAGVTVDGEVVGAIDFGLVVLLGITHGDTEADAAYLAEKIAHLRIFEDEDGKMNRSLLEVGGAVLSVSQFTLYGDCRKGRRPNFMAAAKPDRALPLYEAFNAFLREKGIHVETGVFGAMMNVTLTNDGPVTLIIDSGEKPGNE